MRTKSAYREKAAENIPPVAVAAAPDGPVVAVEQHHEPRAELAALEYAEKATKADEAAEALRKQVEELRKSERLLAQQAQYAAQLQQQRPPTRSEKLAMWRAQGTPEAELEFLEANPELVDYSGLTAVAAAEAAQAGHKRGSHEHMRATKEIFDKHLAHLQAQQQADSAMAPAPKFFAPEPSRPAVRSPIVSAPVSREIASGGPRPTYETDPRRVTLSVDERAIAKNAGISETEYARQKIRMLGMKERGEIQG
jgi:phage I-like protein